MLLLKTSERPDFYVYVLLIFHSVGVSTSSCDYLKFLYEESDNFSVLPTFAVIPAKKCFAPLIIATLQAGFQFDPTKVNWSIS